MADPQATDAPRTIYQRMIDNQQSDYNWMILEVGSDLAVKCVNTGLGIDKLQSSFQDTNIQWAVLLVLAVDQQDNVTSRRTKLVQVNWVGRRVPPMKKMGALSGKSAVTNFAQGVHVTIDCNDREDLTMIVVGKALLQNSGAHKPSHYEFGGGGSIDLNELGLN